MKIDQETVLKIAHLARIEIKSDEVEQLSEGLQQILTWMEKLNEVNTTGIEPLRHMSAEMNALREDRIRNQMARQEAMENSPDPDNQFFRVPKVIG
ncbi:MAG TPA: Asp-tRNA(Asn)/Glu-tRNA(Gln) amidotransferase subunit GatC [Catalimonadaceae bacterium]|nr:Asp-tRNA(Asn)/Glu-tRNA(Gln) amidotransferase subunit GatC [Catalimonadaceae bacterium]